MEEYATNAKTKSARENGFSLWNIDTAEKYNQCSVKK